MSVHLTPSSARTVCTAPDGAVAFSGVKKTGRKILTWVLVLWSLFPGFSWAGEFQLREQNPLTLVFGLPLPGHAAPLSGSEWQTDFLMNIGNTTNVQNSASESLLIDGETTVVDIVISHALNDKWRVGAHIPLISNNGGTLDGFIENYHDLLGLPQGDRKRFGRNLLRYQYVRDGDVLLNFTGSQSGLGDIRILADYQVRREQDNAFAAHASLKLPTGDSDDLTGSGVLDFSAWLSAKRKPAQSWEVYGHAGLLLLGKGEILSSQQRDQVWFLGGALAWQANPVITLQFQLDWHGAFFDDTELKLLGPATTLTTGGFLRVSKNSKIAIAVVEDIDVNSAPDVQFHLGWQYQQ